MAMQPFVWGGNTGQRMTPQQVERERVAQTLMAQQAGDTSPVASPFAGLNRVLQGYIAGRDRSRIDSAEDAGINSARERVAAALGAGFGDVTPTQSQIVAPAAQIPSGEMATAVLDGLVQRGMPEHIAQGFLMNFQDESGLNPGINEQNPLVPGSRGGFGLSQWTGTRRRELEAFANQRGVPVSDVDAQLDFLMSELQGSERGAWNKIANTQDAGSAAAAIVNNFLRPAEEHRARREAQYLGAGAQPASSGPSSNALLALAADPWVAQQYGGVIEALAGQAQQRENMAIEQQYRQADPMYQAQLEAAQLANRQAMMPQRPEPIVVGGVVLDGSTFQPIFDSRQPETASPQSPIAKLEADRRSGLISDEQYAQGLEQMARAGVNVTNNLGGSGERNKKLEGAEGEEWGAIRKAGSNAAAMQSDLALLDELSNMAPQGPIQGRLAQALPGFNDAASAMNSIIMRMAPNMRVEGSGSTSDIEYQGMLRSLPSLVNNPAANKSIIAMMRAKSELDRERSAVVDRYLDGEASDVATRKALREIGSRSIVSPDLRAMLSGLSSEDGTDGQPQRITDKAQFDALPSGATFVAPDGSVRRKP